MKQIKLTPINEPDMMVPNALEIIRGGVTITCNEDRCKTNTGSCTVNKCRKNEKDCSTNSCEGNYLCRCNGQTCYQDMGAIYP